MEELVKVEIFDRNRLFEALQGEEELIREILDGYLKDLTARIEELGSAIGTGAPELIHRIGHSIKGASANVGAIEMSNIASGIEIAGEKNNIARAEELYKDIVPAFDRLSRHLKEM